MEEALLAGGWEGAVSFVPDGGLGVVDPDNRYTNRMPSAMPKLDHLVTQVVDYTVNLLDHRLRQHLDLDADFDCGNGASGNGVSNVHNGRFSRNEFAERPVAAACHYSAPLVLNVQDAIFAEDDGLD
jgi:hypothetical protein